MCIRDRGPASREQTGRCLRVVAAAGAPRRRGASCRLRHLPRVGSLGGRSGLAERRRRDGVDVERRLLPLLSGEVALTVEPQLTGGEEQDGSGPATPYLALLAK